MNDFSLNLSHLTYYFCVWKWQHFCYEFCTWEFLPLLYTCYFRLLISFWNNLHSLYKTISLWCIVSLCITLHHLVFPLQFYSPLLASFLLLPLFPVSLDKIFPFHHQLFNTMPVLTTICGFRTILRSLSTSCILALR